MLHISDQARYFLFREAVDMRKSFHGLAAVVTGSMKKDVLNGDIYIFISKRRNAIKLLQFQGDGFAIYYKLLEKGTFELPAADQEVSALQTTSNELLCIIKGIALKQVKYRPRYAHNPGNC